MSRIGKKPINIPAGVKINMADGVVTVEGPKGKLAQKLPTLVSVKIDGAVVNVERDNDSKDAASRHGLTRTLVDNMVTGVTKGFTKNLEIVGVGYKVALKGKSLDFSIGKSHPVVVEPPAGIEFAVEGTQKITVKGIDKQLVGQVASDIRMIRKPEPYKGKGIRYAGERIMLKAGKTGKK